MVFAVGDLGSWLVGLLADARRKKLTTLVLGTDQERALRRAATAAVQAAAAQFAPSGGEPPGQLAMMVSEVFREPEPDVALAGQATLLQALRAGIVANLAVLDDPALTGTGQSSAQLLGVPASELAEALADHLVREIMVRGSGGGPLAPLADQLNHDRTYLQQVQGFVELADLVKAGQLAVDAGQAGGAAATVGVPSGPRGLLADVDARLTGGQRSGPRVVAVAARRFRNTEQIICA